MPTITMSISEELKKQMGEFREINWSEITREAISEKLKRLRLLKELDKSLKNSKLTDGDCLRLGRELKDRIWKKHKEKGW